MGHWNYRIVKHSNENPDAEWFGLYETYYNDEGKVCAITENPETTGATVEELTESIKMMLKDAEKDAPILEYDEIENNCADLREEF